jgi:2-haloacid dehalogenase
MNAEALKRSIKICMFDQYGTIVDMQGGLTEHMTVFLEGKNFQGSANDVVTWWRRTHFENSMIDALLQRQHTPYREIGHLSLGHVLQRAGIPHTREDVQRLVSCIERLKPFPEVPQALARLRTRYRLAVLSNGDLDMLEEAKKHHGIAFDAVVSAAAANAFKPHVATYTKAVETLGVAMDEVLFVANHEFDCVGAKSAGMRAAFIDRRRRPFASWPYQPDLIVGNMGQLADVMT